MAYELPHIKVTGGPTTDPFQARASRGPRRTIHDIPNRGAHAAARQQELTGAIATEKAARDQ